MLRIAALVSHPIQYQAPLFRELSQRPGVDLTVFFCSEWGVGRHLDPDFGSEFAWDSPLLDGYRHVFLKPLRAGVEPNAFWRVANFDIFRRLSESHWDAVWIHGWSYLSHWLCFAGSRLKGIPILLRGETNGLTEPAGIKYLIKRSVLKGLFANVSAFLAIGRRNGDYYQSFGIPSQKIFRAPYAVDNASFGSAANRCERSRREIRRAHGIAEDPPLVLFSGKLIPRKGPMDLLLACRELNRRRPVSLAFAGDGSERERLSAAARDLGLPGAHFLGFKNQSDLPACYSMADVFVLPSLWEQWGLVVNEAMAGGLPVITSDTVGCALDLVDEGVNGYTFPAGNITALANKLGLVLESPERARAMGEASAKIIRGYSVGAAADGVIAAATAVSGSRSATRQSFAIG